jgi:hypothetical protein
MIDQIPIHGWRPSSLLFDALVALEEAARVWVAMVSNTPPHRLGRNNSEWD